MDASAENLYFTDVGNHSLRAVDLATGVIATVAGGRPPEMGASPAGDGGPATEAAFSTHPMRVALDAVGHLYVTDAHQNRVRRIDAATGLITTVAGNGEEGFAGDGGPATAASLAVPHGCRFDRDGNLYIADTHNHRIRRVDAATGVVATVAGTGEKGYAGDGLPALESKLYAPLAVDVAANGDLYIVDTDNLRFRCLEAATGILRTVAGCGEMGPTETGIPALEAKFGRPRDIRVRGGQVYLVDGNNSSIFRLDLGSGLLHRGGRDRKQRLLRGRRTGGPCAARPLLQHGHRPGGEHLRQGQRQPENPLRRRGERPDLHGGRQRRARLLRRRRTRPRCGARHRLRDNPWS